MAVRIDAVVILAMLPKRAESLSDEGFLFDLDEAA
jgi:hypothetical protein